jgi:hypothetical protein
MRLATTELGLDVAACGRLPRAAGAGDEEEHAPDDRRSSALTAIPTALSALER